MEHPSQKHKLMALALVLVLVIGGSLVVFMSRSDDSIEKYPVGQMTVRRGDNVMIVSAGSPYYPLIATPVAMRYEVVSAGTDVRGGARSAGSGEGLDGGTGDHGPTGDTRAPGERSGGMDRIARPLLVLDPQDPSQAVIRFMDAYTGPKDTALVGDLPNPGLGFTVRNRFHGSLREISGAVALSYWESSTAAMIIVPDSDGYSVAVSAVPLASYLNMPVLISHDISGAYDILRSLGVETLYLCGNVRGSFFGETVRMRTPVQARERVLEVMERLSLEVGYIAMANPLDAFEPEILDTIVYDDFSGIIEHSETGSAANPGDSDRNAPITYFMIPEDFRWARITIDTRLEIEDMALADLTGDRIYAYVGTDLNRNGVILNDPDSPEDRLHFMDPSLAYGYIHEGGKWWCHGLTSRPMYNAQGELSLQVLASLPSRQHTSLTPSAAFRVTVTVDKLKEPHFPLMPGLSAMAPYLAAYRQGVVLADPDFSVHASEELLDLPFSGHPDTAMYLMEPANRKVQEIKDELDDLLGELAGIPEEMFTRGEGMDGGGVEEGTGGAGAGDEGVDEGRKQYKIALANHYRARIPDDPLYLGIIADTNMIPLWHDIVPDEYGYGPYEGYGITGDVIYGDIDTDAEYLQSSNGARDYSGHPPDMEIPVGRIGGWDSQDASALLARTFFYYDIIDSFPGIGGFAWKESAFAHFGTMIPVETSATVVQRFRAMWTEAGFLGMPDPLLHSNQMSRRQLTRELYERSNYHFFCAHGFYYWYVPTAQENLLVQGGGIIKGTAAGGAFTTASVKDMNMGPGVIFGSSCVTGKIDGIPGRNALSMAFLHAGMNVYIGASRLSYGSLVPIPDQYSDETLGNYLGSMYYAYMSGGMYYDKMAGMTHPPYRDLSSGLALMLAKNKYVQDKGTDGVHMTTYIEFMHLGDPAFNPYEPVNNG